MITIEQLAAMSDKEVQQYKDRHMNATATGHINKNNQQTKGTNNVQGNGPGQVAYELHCLNCDFHYGCNGFDIWERKCPNCQNGKAGIPYA